MNIGVAKFEKKSPPSHPVDTRAGSPSISKVFQRCDSSANVPGFYRVHMRHEWVTISAKLVQSVIDYKKHPNCAVLLPSLICLFIQNDPHDNSIK